MTPDVLELAIAAFQKGAMSCDDVLKAYYRSPRVKRLIAHACITNRVSLDFGDEVRQDLALLIMDKFLEKIVDPDKIYNVLHRSADFMARRRSSKSSSKSEISLEELLEHAAEPDTMLSDESLAQKTLEDQVADRIDHQRAVAEFNRRLNKQMPVHTAQKPSMPLLKLDLALRTTEPAVIQAIARDKPTKLKAKPDRTKRDLTRQALELNEIRAVLGYTVPVFGEMLNLSKGTLSSYLYGIVQEIPPQVMADARALRDQGNAVAETANKVFGFKSMSEIVESWLVQLSSSTDAREELCKVLNIDRTTLWRWTEREMRPSMSSLLGYQELVTKRQKQLLRNTTRAEARRQAAS